MRDQFLGRFGRALPVGGDQVTDFLKPSFAVAFLMLLGAALLCWLGRIGEAGYLTITLAVGAGYGLSAPAAQALKNYIRETRL